MAAQTSSSAARIAIAGLGAIGLKVAEALDAGIPGCTLAAVSARNTGPAADRLSHLRRPVPIVAIEDLEPLADIVVECAPAHLLPAIVEPFLRAGKTAIVLSCGALLQHDSLVDVARTFSGQIIVPAGALIGLDAVAAAAEGEIRSVHMITRKPIAGLAGAPYLIENSIDIDSIHEPLLLFKGTARAAAAGFPANLNVAVALSLAGIGPDRTTLEIWADPHLERNTHRIEVDADSARFSMVIENIPSENPRTGRITALSVISCLRKINAPQRIAPDLHVRGTSERPMKEIPWLGGPLPRMRLEAHYGDRVIECFAEGPRGLFDLFANAVLRNPEGEAIVFDGQRISWRELDRKVTSLAAAFAQRGIQTGDRIGLFVGNRPEFVIALFAAARLGAISVPLGIRQQRDEIAYALADCGASALIHDADLAERVPAPNELPSLRHRFSIGNGSEWLELLSPPKDPQERLPAGEEDTAVILYTSGTTGRPKGAMLTNLNVVNSALAYEHCMGLRQNERCLMAVPLSHVTGLVAGIAATARCACTLIIMPSFRAADFLALAAAERMTYTMMVPAMYNLCLLQPDFAKFDLSAWRIGSYGGAPMPPATIAAFARQLPKLLLMNAYGATETTSPTTLMPPCFTATHGDRVGLPIPGAKVTIMDDNGSELPVYEVGEIWIGGASVVRGYWNNPTATQKEFTGGFWHSGDLGSIDADGFVSVLDRKKDMLNRGGHKIYTAEVEAVLAAHEDVVESAIIGRPCPVLGERVHAYVVTRSGATAPESLRHYLAERLADYKVPETMHVSTDPLPRNSNGKVMKRQLRERLLSEFAAAERA